MSSKIQNPRARAIAETAERWGIPESTAVDIAKNELFYWSAEEFSSVLQKVRGMKADLKSVEDKPLHSALNSALTLTQPQKPYWIKAPKEMVEQSAKEDLALCVNAAGELSLRQDGFAAISHVWVEGIQADPDNGLPYHFVEQIFQKIGQIDVEWIWLDGIAIPAGHRKLSLNEELLKIGVINCLASIYRRADAVIVLDAMVMRLQSKDPIDVAVSIVCGKWMTRVWTYQEAKLATKLLVVTGLGLVDVGSVFLWVDRSRIDPQNNSHKYSELYKTFGRMLRNDNLGVSLPDIALSCRTRVTGNDIDYARALFPVLGLTWKINLTKEEGMRVIYESQRNHASRLVLMHGSPRNFWPGWAPAQFKGLEGMVLSPFTWRPRGLERSWYTYRVKEILPSKSEPPNMILKVETKNADDAMCGCYPSVGENEKSIALFHNAVANGTAYMLAHAALYPVHHFAKHALLVERAPDRKEDEAWVCLTAAVFDIERSSAPPEIEWLLLHENPVSDHFESGKGLSAISHSMSELDRGEHDSESLLHIAARNGDEANIQLLLDSGWPVDQQDDRGWTPLQSAAAAGKTSIIRLLAKRGANVNAQEKTEHRTAVSLAADKGHNEAIQELVDLGADINLTHPNWWSPLNQAILANQVDTVGVLLYLGADPSGPDAGGWMPSIFAIEKPEILNMLLDAGADPTKRGNGGLGAIHAAARSGNTTALTRLLQDPRVNVDMPERETATGGRNTPLYEAVKSQHHDAVEILLNNNADPNSRSIDDWTPLMMAAELGDVKLMQMLINAGALIEVVCEKEGRTPLHLAARKGRRVAVKYLVEGGADVNAKDVEGATALSLAAAGKFNSVVEVLQKAARKELFAKGIQT
ncbi:hypothetical protein MMC30_000254 [Trapelia coarctata]|nr:hypothetical protein [Trapelia coarctata]